MARVITVSGTNLFRVAAEECGFAGQWWRIAQLNGLKSPDLPGITTLRIPDITSNNGDGIPAPGER